MAQGGRVEVLIPVVSIVGGVILVVVMIWHQARMREMAMRERVALIERGLVPSPETDPARFEAVLGRAAQRPRYSERANERASRYRTAGILFMGFGVALMMIIAFAANDPRTAFGVGGAFVAVGMALVVNSLFVAPRRADIESPPPAPPPSPPAEGQSESRVNTL
jgi:hypothetical protein